MYLTKECMETVGNMFPYLVDRGKSTGTFSYALACPPASRFSMVLNTPFLSLLFFSF